MEKFVKLVPHNVLVYLWLILVSYLAYELLRDKIPNKIKYFILSRSFILLIITLLGAFLVLDNNLKQALFTFSSIYLGFWLNEQVKAQEERRKLKFFLGAVWQELRYNRVQLETLKKNYSFFMNDEKNLEIMYLKFTGLQTHTGFLKSTVYDSFVSSTVITALKKDETFNDLTLAYTNIKFLQSALGIVQTDFDIKLKTHHYAIATMGKNIYAKEVLEELGRKIVDGSGKELAIAYRSVCMAIDTVNEYLNTMMVKSDESEKPEDILTDEDKKFLKEILKVSPDKIPKDLFNYTES